MKRLHAIRAIWILVMLYVPLLLMSCGGTDDPADIPVDSGVATLEIRDKSELASTLIPVGTELILDAIAENKEGLNVTFGGDVLFGDTVNPVSMRWSSSTPSVARITQGGQTGNSGVLKALSPGRTTITVEASGVKDSVQITIQ